MPPELRHIGNVKANPRWSLGNQRHDHTEILVVSRGRHACVLEGVDFWSAAGDVIVFRPKQLHEEAVDPRNPAQWYFIGLNWPSMPVEIPSRLRDVHGRLRQLTAWLHDERHNQTHESSHARSTFFNAFIAELTRLSLHHEHPLLEDIRRYVRHNIDRLLTLDDLASHAEMSKYHFLRLYKKLAGRTPMDDVRELRVEFARDLILTTDLPLKAIADRAGLGDQSHLSRLFRRQLGITPSSLRR